MTSTESWPALQKAIERAKQLEDRPGGLSRRLVGRLGGLVPGRRFKPGIYIFSYHGIVDPDAAAAWELAYPKGVVSARRFAEQVTYLARHMTPVRLSEVPALAAAGVDKPLFCITFDDGYANVAKNGADVLERLGISPAFFVNARFAAGAVYFRVLAAMIVRRGFAAELASALRSRLPGVAWTDEPGLLFAQTKIFYRPVLVEEAVEETFERVLGAPRSLCVHAGFDELRDLARRGWEMGNHTYSHVSLQAADAQTVRDEVERNAVVCRENGLPLLSWLAYPNGSSTYVAQPVKQWLDRNPQIQGTFGVGGVNLVSTRTEWLRMPAEDVPWRQFDAMIRRDYSLTRRVLAELPAVRD